MPSTRASTVRTSARLRSDCTTAASSPMPTSSQSGAGGRPCRMRAMSSCSEQSPTVAAASVTAALLRVIGRTGFANDRHFDLAGVLQFVLDAPRDVLGQPHGLLVRDLLALDHDSDLAPGLQRERLRHAPEGIGDPLELLET